MDLHANKRQCFRLLNEGNHGFLGPKSDLDLLNNRKRCRLIAKQINVNKQQKIMIYHDKPSGVGMTLFTLKSMKNVLMMPNVTY